MVPVVRMPPLKARPIPICARFTDHSIFRHGDGPYFNILIKMQIPRYKFDKMLGSLNFP